MIDDEFEKRVSYALASINAVIIIQRAQIDALTNLVALACSRVNLNPENGFDISGFLNAQKAVLIDESLKSIADDFPSQASMIHKMLKPDEDESVG